MEENKKKLIKALCLVGIFILSLFIILPPVLKFLLPDNDEYENIVTLETLSCEKELEDGSQKIISTHYKNDEVQKIEIEYLNKTDTTKIDETNFYNISGITKTDKNNTLSITIIPNNMNRDLISTLINPIQEQFSIYADGDYDFTCEIIENY